MLPNYLFRCLTLFALAVSPLWLMAQDISHNFDWSPAPTAITFNDETSIKYEFAGSVPGSFEKTILPYWVETFAVAGPGALEVEVISAEYENFVADQRADLSVLEENLTFQTSISRQPEGYLGKISCLPMIRSISGFQRLKSIELRISRRTTTVAAPRFDFASRSVLADGEVYKFAVSESGVYKLSRGFLKDELGIANLDDVDPRSIRIYGQHGGILPPTITEDLPDDLIEQSIYVQGEGDGNFNGGDFIVFYAEGPSVWEYDASSDRYDRPANIYATQNFYYLKIGSGNGLRVTETNATGGTAINSYDALYRFEEEEENPLHNIGTASGSGQFWFGDFFKVSRERDYNNLFTIPDLVAGEAAILSARMALRATTNSRFIVEVSGQEIASGTVSRVSSFSSALTTAGVKLGNLRGNVNLSSPQVSFKVSYPMPANASDSEGWLDYLQLRARRQLKMTGGQITVRDSRTFGQSTATLQLSGATAETRIWRLGNGNHRQLGGSLNGGTLTANTTLDPEMLETFVAFNLNAGLLQAKPIGRVANQDLHGVTQADMIIVCHPEFLENTQVLAEHRRSHSGLNVSLVTTEQIYNEFSSGKADPASIRNYARMLYERSPDLRYLLLVGDGSFDARDIYGLGTNFVPVYEQQRNFSEVQDFPADDFYGIFTPTANAQPLNNDLNISIGRLPVRSRDQVLRLIQKIKGYDINPEALGDWRTKMVFVGDDEDNTLHTADVDGIAQLVKSLKPELNFDKLYFDLFPQESLSAGDRFPAITEGLDLAVTRGALAITYLGHGGPRGWAQERVLSIPQIRNWRNPDHLPIFITATCTFAGFDDAEFVSAGEETLLSERGGAVALLTTTRPVYANSNEVLTRNTMRTLIERPNGQFRTLGEVIRIAKNLQSIPSSSSVLTTSTENVRKFTLLGDPATVVALPENQVRTTMVNGQEVSPERADTVRALQQMTISGEVTDVNGQLLEDFNGLVYPTVYDKPQTISTLQQDPGSGPLDVEVQRNIVFRGRATVTNGRFNFTFVVPRDINYDFGKGKISYYAADPATRRDGAGFYDQLIIGGTFADAVADDQGPEVEVFMNNEDFVFGGEVETEATLLVKLSDDLGINVTGNSIGHDLEAVIDENTREAIVLNDYYEANADDFRSGEVRYPLTELEPGRHTISVRAWDVANNNATGVTEFIVATDGRSALSRVLNYPNPFTDQTCFQFDHTLTGQDVDVIIQIYTVSGRLVKSLTGFLPFSDGAVRLDDCIEWDGKDDYGDQLARGVYLYQVRLRSQDSEEVVDGEFEKLVILK